MVYGDTLFPAVAGIKPGPKPENWGNPTGIIFTEADRGTTKTFIAETTGWYRFHIIGFSGIGGNGGDATPDEFSSVLYYGNSGGGGGGGSRGNVGIHDYFMTAGQQLNFEITQAYVSTNFVEGKNNNVVKVYNGNHGANGTGAGAGAGGAQPAANEGTFNVASYRGTAGNRGVSGSYGNSSSRVKSGGAGGSAGYLINPPGTTNILPIKYSSGTNVMTVGPNYNVGNAGAGGKGGNYNKTNADTGDVGQRFWYYGGIIIESGV